MNDNQPSHHSSNEVDEHRRHFIGASAALAGLTVAPGVVVYGLAHAKPDSEPVTNKVRWGLLVDATQCAEGCTDCVTACHTENAIQTGALETDPHWIRKVELKDMRTGRSQSLPVMCQHCEDAPCVDVCPTGASFKRADGIVLVDRHTCIGCRYCVMACPYKARSFIHETLTDQNPDVPRGKGCVESCTMCVHRVDRDQQPACVEACSQAGHNAIIFGDLNNPNSDIAKRVAGHPTSQLRADLALNPGVRYEGL
ncbi:MAG: 4Fe-4S dicluster domain-containing protein [Burkholderiales bacterium]|nr:4Fe-4S dicluster domain-containing protein [Burkholderiales bacterium]